MIIKRDQFSLYARITLPFMLMMVLIATPSCKSQESKAFNAVKGHLNKVYPGFKDLKLELFHTNPSFPDKAYISVSFIHPFASGDKPQPDFLGLILVKEGSEWKVAPVNNPPFTRESKDADRYLAGQK